jgi:hypothetical protein
VICPMISWGYISDLSSVVVFNCVLFFLNSLQVIINRNT